MSGLPDPPGPSESQASPPAPADYGVPTNQNIVGPDGEVLTEVLVSDEPIIEDDDESLWTDQGDNIEEGVAEDGDMAVDGDLGTGVEDMAIAVFAEHIDYVCSACLNPRRPGMAVTGGGDDRAFLWTFDCNVNSASPGVLTSRELAGHTDTITCVGFNFDGTMVMTGSYDGSIRVWDVTSGELVVVLEGPEDIEWATWHSKGNAIIAGSKDGTIWMWMTHNGQCVQVFAGHDGMVSVGCFSSDGKVIVSGGEDGTVRVWAPKTGMCKHVFDGKASHDAAITCIVSDELDAELLATGSIDGTVKLFHLTGKRVLQTFVHCRPEAIEGSASAVMEPIDEEDDENMGVQKEESVLSVECVGFARGSLRWIASGGMDKTLKIWDTTNGSCRNVCSHKGGVVSLRWHSVLPVVCTGCLDNLVRIWDARNGNLLVQLTGHRDQITYIDMVSFPNSEGTAANLDSIICTSDDHTSRIFQVDVHSLLG